MGGNRKQLLVEDELRRNGVDLFPGSSAWVRELREAGLKTAVVSSSRNCRSVLDDAGITNLFDAQVDGDTTAGTRVGAMSEQSKGCRGGL
jgi:alpha,alpha-trehalose phosphorylase